jgi:hypothetical protein
MRSDLLQWAGLDYLLPALNKAWYTPLRPSQLWGRLEKRTREDDAKKEIICINSTQRQTPSVANFSMGIA